MTLKRMVVEIGMGVDLRGEDHTKAAARAARDAIQRNSVTVGPALGFPPEKMQISVTIGAPDPSAVDPMAVAAVFPYGEVAVMVKRGGLSVEGYDGRQTLMASAAVEVFFDMKDRA